MATNMYLNIGPNGFVQLTPAVTGGASKAGQLVALNSAGQIDPTMLSSSLGSPQVTVTAAVAISAGQLVNLTNNSGVLTAQLADCSTGLPAQGFATAAISASTTGTVQLSGLNASVTGLTPAAPLYLSTAGGVSATAPTTSGYIVQAVGVAVSATEMEFNPSNLPVTLG